MYSRLCYQRDAVEGGECRLKLKMQASIKKRDLLRPTSTDRRVFSIATINQSRRFCWKCAFVNVRLCSFFHGINCNFVTVISRIIYKYARGVNEWTRGLIRDPPHGISTLLFFHYLFRTIHHRCKFCVLEYLEVLWQNVTTGT